MNGRVPQFDLSLADLWDYRPEVGEPDDFDEFWQKTLTEARAYDLAVTLEPVDNKLALIDSYDLTFAGFGGTPVKAWLHVPAGASGPLPTVVHYLGYSGGRGFPHTHTVWAQAGWAHLVVDTRGQGWSYGGGSSTNDASPDAGAYGVPGFITTGIADPRTYYYRRVFTDAVRLLEVARSHELLDPARIVATGRSQGGAITLAVAGLAPLAGLELLGAAPDVPFLCHFRRAVEITDEGPYAELTAFLAGWRHLEGTAYETLSYFDGVNFARRAAAPALFSVGLMDQVCPPSTVFAAYHAYGGGAAAAKDIKVYPHNGHEGGDDYQIDAQLSWFAKRFAG